MSLYKKILLAITSSLLFLSPAIAKEGPHVQFADEAIRQGATELREEFDLIYIGSGGGMSDNIEEIHAYFLSYQKPSIELARKMAVKAIQKLQTRINAHEKIKPFLKEYPMKTDRITLSVYFNTRDHKYYKDGNIAFVSFADNKLSFRALEEPKQQESLITKAKDDSAKEKEHFYTLFDESYEQALKALETSPTK